MGLKCGQLNGQLADRGEVADESDPCGQGDGHPDGVLGDLAPGLVERERFAVKLDASVARTFQAVLDPDKEKGPDTLRTGIAAPYAPGENRDEKQAKRTDDQQPREQDEFLWVKGGSKNMKLTPGQVEPDQWPVAPVQPGQSEKGQHQNPVGQAPHALEQSLDLTDVDMTALGVHLLLDGSLWRVLLHWGGHVLHRYLVAHFGLAAGNHGP